mgnify:CR=1 FL=1
MRTKLKYGQLSTEKPAREFARIRSQLTIRSHKTTGELKSVDTENKKTDTYLTKPKNKYDLHQIFETICVPLLVINRDHRVTHWNRACEKLTGIKADEVVGTDNQWQAFYDVKRPILADLIIDQRPEEDILTFYTGSSRKSSLIEGAYEVESHFPSLGANGYWLYFTAAPLFNRENEIIGAIETFQDITDRETARAELQSAIQKLRVEQKALEEKNIVLNGVLKQIDSEKQKISDRIQSNVNLLIIPMLSRLEDKLDPQLQAELNRVKANLEDITTPFIDKLDKSFSRLSPRELEICSHIKNGLSSKDIAGQLNVSVGTIQQQRKMIRKKLQIANQKINLSAFLKNL